MSQRREGSCQMTFGSRLQIEVDGCSLLVPYPVAICRHHAKLVIPRSQVRVIRYAAIAAIDPIAIKAFELIFESHILRGYKTGRRVIKVEARAARSKLH